MEHSIEVKLTMSWVLDFADKFRASMTYCSNKYNLFQKIKKKKQDDNDCTFM